jgi:hypothetical protein
VTEYGEPVALTGGGRSAVHRQGDAVIRDAGPWTPAVFALLRHLEKAVFAGAPRLVGTGLDIRGRETLTFIEGEFTQPGPLASVAGAGGQHARGREASAFQVAEQAVHGRRPERGWPPDRVPRPGDAIVRHTAPG